VIAARNLNGIPSPYAFRSYIHPVGDIIPQCYRLNPDDRGCSLETWEVARATSAAPGYFKTYKTQNPENEFMDGGICANNPSMVVWNEACQMAKIQDPSSTPAKAIGCLVSLGTGKSSYEIFGRAHQPAISKYLNMNKAPRKMITDTVSQGIISGT
jgi:Patatin-like phospholipase